MREKNLFVTMALIITITLTLLMIPSALTPISREGQLSAHAETPGTRQAVDFSATNTIANLTEVYPVVQVYEGEMMLEGAPVTITYNFTVSRIDSYDTPAIVHAGVALMRNNMTNTEYCLDHVVVADDKVGFGIGPQYHSITMTWNETEVDTPFEPSIWNISGYVYVIAETEYDENPDNNEVSDIYLVEALKLNGDLNGDGTIDIFDWVILTSHFGGGPEYPDLYNPLCDLMPDGTIDMFDVLIIARVFGRSLGEPGQPDPVPWPLTIVHNGETYDVIVFSDYIVYSNYTFDPWLGQLNFIITSSVDAFCNITIPKDLMSGAFTVYLDGVPTPSIITWNSTYTFIYFTSTELYNKVKIMWDHAFPIPGDINHDGIVDIYDAIMLSENFGKENP